MKDKPIGTLFVKNNKLKPVECATSVEVPVGFNYYGHINELPDSNTCETDTS